MDDTGWDDVSSPWRSGPWGLQRRGDELADLTYDGRRVLRSIRAVVRDRDWNTAAWIVGDPVADDGMLRLPLRSSGHGSDVRGEVMVSVTGDTLSVVFDAVSHTAFATNRTGLVVLHPPQAAGAPLRVEHPDGSVSETVFPREISAHQPVFDIAGLCWLGDGAEVSVTFTGDVFEMEDQRNWTDASYKTYSRPLALPFPYDLAAGERVVQRVDVRVRTVAADGEATASEVIALAPAGAFPAVGVSASTAPDPEPAGLSRVGSSLLVELDLDTPTWRAALRRAAGRGLPLDVRVVPRAPDPRLLAAFAAEVRALDVRRVAVFHPVFHVSEASFVAALRTALTGAGVDVPVAGGSRAHFTELNRERGRMPAGLDALAVTLTPLFHSLSGAQLRESVAMQRLVAQQTVAYAGEIPVLIGPVSLRPRFNDVATGAQTAPTRDDLAEGYGAAFTGTVDDRQTSPELAAWTIASAAALAVPGVAELTFFEEWGPRGIRSATGNPAPAAAAVEALAALSGTLLWGASPDGLVWALGARGADGDVVLAASLDRAPREIEIAIADAAPHRIPLPPRGWTRLAL